jgi:phage gpG-like protein
MIRIEVKDREVLEALRQLASRCSHPTRAMREIGELVAERVKERFGTGIGPDGARWAPNTETTYLQYLAEWKGSYTTKGKLSKQGSGRAATKRPLIGRTRSLSTTIYYRAYPSSVEIGSPMVYAGVQQFGARKKQFGQAPWGDIPARPFLGISDRDRASMRPGQ